MRRLITAAALAFLCAAMAWADDPGLKPGVKLQSNGGDLKLSYDVNPCVVDWNSDGLKDLLVGEFTGGYISYYQNVGTDLNPVFGSPVKINSGGTPITVTYG
jgi:hypothetical protein